MDESRMGHWLMTGILLVSSAGIGCNGDDGDSNQTGRDAAVQRDSSATGQDGAPPVDATAAQADAAALPDAGSTTGACTSAADRAIIDGDTFEDALSSCAMSCAFGADPDCNVNCIANDTGLSSGCSECFADNVQCTMDNCLSQCASDASSPQCTACMEDAGCVDDIATCSGIEL